MVTAVARYMGGHEEGFIPENVAKHQLHLLTACPVLLYRKVRFLLVRFSG